MMRMDRYKDVDEKESLQEEKNVVLSREKKNQDMYTDVYMNKTLVDINSIFSPQEDDELAKTKEMECQQEIYEEKSYDVNEYIQKAHEMHKDKEDNLKRKLDDTFIRGEDEIKKLIQEIEERENSEDIFSDLKGDNEDTLIEGKLNTDEFDSKIYEALMEDVLDLKKGNTALDKALGDETVLDLVKKSEENLDHTFERIIQSDEEEIHRSKKLPIIVFSITLFVLILVVFIILLVK